MNNLNSVLIEGFVSSKPEMMTEKVCKFQIISTRQRKLEPPENTEILIKTEGDLLSRQCLDYLTVKRGVRIIGRLSQSKEGLLYVTAEHVEFKPKEATE